MSRYDLYGMGLAAMVLLVGCVGTDLVDEEPGDARIVLDPPTAAVQEGNTVQFNATYFDPFDRQQAVAMQWEVADPSVATVDGAGVVQALQIGQTTLWAKAGDVTSDPAMITVVANENAVAQVVVSPPSVQLEAGATQVFTATALNVNGDLLDGISFTWHSADPTIATIDDAGTATALQPGITTITATAEGVISAPAQLGVTGGSRRGMFTRRPGTSYNLEGHVTLQEAPDGSLTLQLESDFSSSQGPGLYVYLSSTNTVTSSSLEVGELQSVSGASTYNVPGTTTLTTYDWVIIHCKPFNVTFGYAQLQ